jgi:hypothetical protein
MLKRNLYKSACAAFLFALCLIGGAGQMFAQSQASTGQISGTVRDSAGAAVPSATVRVTNTRTGLQQSATTSEDGVFRFVLLPPSTYNLTAEAANFSKTEVNNVVVTVGQTADANITLGVSAVSESVTVTADVVQTTAPQSDTLFSQAQIDNLPINGRRFQDFVQLTPTALVEPSRNQISLSGQRGINTNVNIDGMDYNQPFFGGIRGGERSNNAYTVPQESIQEFQVVAAGYSAEFGRSSGGIVNVITKSGTNDFHGSAFYLHRDKALSRNTDYFQAFEADLRSRGLSQEVIAAPTQQQWGGSIGGPINRDKMFFFGSYEQQRVRQGRAVYFQSLRNLSTAQVAALAPATRAFYDRFLAAEGPFDQSNDALALLGRFDYQINNANRFNIRYNFSDNEGVNANATGDAVDPITTRALSNNGTEKDRTHTVVGQLSSFFASNVVNELRGQYSREIRPRLSNSTDPNISTGIGNLGARNFLPTTQFDWRFQLVENLTYIAGNHTTKFGAEINHVYINQEFGFNQFGVLTLLSTNTANAAGVIQILDLLAGANSPGTASTITLQGAYDDPTRGRFNQQIGNLQTAYSSDNFALYGQDSWRIRPNFTLNFGLRWEGQFLPAPAISNEPLTNLVRNYRSPIGNGLGVDPTRFPDFGDQVAPRLGFAWDPTSNGKTVIRGHAGIYYANSPLLLLSTPYNNFRFPAGDLSVTLPFVLPANRVPNAACPTNAACDSLFEQLSLIGYNFNNPRPLTLAEIGTISQRVGVAFNPQLPQGLAPLAFANDFQNPRSFQVGGAFQREIGTGFVVGLDLSYVNTVHLQRNRDINLPAPIAFPVPGGDPAGRPFFGTAGSITFTNVPGGGNQVFTVRQRPLPQLSTLTLRESTARSLYRAATARAELRRRWGQFSAFYTLSHNTSDDDNERDATGFQYVNAYDLGAEYGYSNLDQRHQFVANAVFFMPWGIEVGASTIMTSARPFTPTVGTDVNQDGINNDRPYAGPGIPFARNSARNRPFRIVNLRPQKRISFSESKSLTISAEFFNLFNFSNIQFGGSQLTYCTGVNVATRANLNCGFAGPTNINYRSLTEQNTASARFGQLLLNNNPGSVFQVQLGARFQF